MRFRPLSAASMARGSRSCVLVRLLVLLAVCSAGCRPRRACLSAPRSTCRSLRHLRGGAAGATDEECDEGEPAAEPGPWDLHARDGAPLPNSACSGRKAGVMG